MDAIQTLDGILNLSGKELSKSNRDKAVDALLILFSDTENYGVIVKYLMKLHYSVCGAFIRKLITSQKDNEIKQFTKSLAEDEAFIGSKAQNVLYPKGFAIVAVLLQLGKYDCAYIVLNKILLKSKKQESFQEGSINKFSDYVLSKCDRSCVGELMSQLINRTIPCDDSSRERMLRFLGRFNESTLDNTVEHPDDEKSESAEPTVITTGEAVSAPPKQQGSDRDEVVSLKEFRKAHREIVTLLNAVTNSKEANDMLVASLAQRDSEVSALTAEKTRQSGQIADLNVEVAGLRGQLKELDQQNADLTERLKCSLQMDRISTDQELATLKSGIAEALKLDYADYVSSVNDEYSPDLFELYRAALTRIFKLLKRYGIDCQ